MDQKKDIVLPADAPTELLLAKHVEYIRRWIRDTDDYEYQVSEVRIACTCHTAPMSRSICG